MAAVEAISRSSDAAEELFERHADRIFGFCLKRVGSRQEAEDAVQTTFLCALRALQRGVVPVSETAWLFKIAQNVCLTSHRSNGRRPEILHGPELMEGVAASEHDADELFGLGDALAVIPESQRRAIVLREWHGLSYREIARELGLSLAAVETLIFRARRSLAQALNGGTGLRQRLVGVADASSFLGTLKSLLGGATVAKVAAGAAVIAVATLPAGDSSREAGARDLRAPVRAAESASSVTRTSWSRRDSQPAAGRAARHDRKSVPTGGRSRSAPSNHGRSGPTRRVGGTAGNAAQASPAEGATRVLERPLEPPSVRLPLPPVPPVEPPVSLPRLPDLPVQPPALPELPNLPVQPPDLPVRPPDLPELPLHP